MSITETAPAKVILVGEHAVVYGQPAIAVPVSSLRARAAITTDVPQGQGLRIIAANLDIELPVDAHTLDNALALTAHLVLRELQTDPPDMTITLDSQIPLAGGMGSGAAVSTTLGRALSAALGKPLDNPTLNDIVYEVEKIHHGTPSGIDNTVIVYEQPIYFIRGYPIENITIHTPLHLLIANTGHGALTRESVADVRRLYEQNRIQLLITAIGDLVNNSRQAIETGDTAALGALMSQNHTLLQELTVSSTQLDQLVSTAINAGALGAKLSGGGRGGNMIALVEAANSDSVAKALSSAGAVEVIATVVS